MKKIIIAFACIALLTACDETKKVNAPEPEATVEAPEKEVVTVSGKVQAIVNGKDGYTAKIITADSTLYFITASIPNSTDPKNYYRVAVGENVTVKGEQWMLDTEKHITVRAFIK